MDDDKLRVLREIDYTIAECCALCVHSDFAPLVDWGVCRIHTYTHQKHNGGAEGRELSINRHGVCPKFMLDLNEVPRFSGFIEFIKPA